MTDHQHLHLLRHPGSMTPGDTTSLPVSLGQERCFFVGGYGTAILVLSCFLIFHLVTEGVRVGVSCCVTVVVFFQVSGASMRSPRRGSARPPSGMLPPSDVRRDFGGV